jgi:multicomponent Na+:H+ antiporter subunit E
MTVFIWNVLLAVVWAAAVGEITLSNVVVGFVLGYAVLWLSRDVLDTRDYCRRVPRLLEFLLFFLWELLLANLRVAYDVLTPKFHMNPGIIALPLDARTDNEITLLANVISLTPGTLSLDVSEDRRFLFVHSMYILDLEQEKQRLKDRLERRLLQVLR